MIWQDYIEERPDVASELLLLRGKGEPHGALSFRQALRRANGLIASFTASVGCCGSLGCHLDPDRIGTTAPGKCDVASRECRLHK